MELAARINSEVNKPKKKRNADSDTESESSSSDSEYSDWRLKCGRTDIHFQY
jgi:hypothetical protein